MSGIVAVHSVFFEHGEVTRGYHCSDHNSLQLVNIMCNHEI